MKRGDMVGVARWVVATLAFALLLTGCARPPHPSAVDHDELARVERAWVASGLPEPGNCLAGARIRDVTPEEADRQCEKPTYACLLRESARPMKPAYWVIVVGQQSTRLRDIRHEALHALVRCTLRRGLHTDPFDREHSDPRVWESGGAGSVEQRARLP